MDRENNTNRVTSNILTTSDEYVLLETRITETCKHGNHDFTINSKQLTDNINFLFNTTYTQQEVDYVLGGIYEKQFYYERANHDL